MSGEGDKPAVLAGRDLQKTFRRDTGEMVPRSGSRLDRGALAS